MSASNDTAASYPGYPVMRLTREVLTQVRNWCGTSQGLGRFRCEGSTRSGIRADDPNVEDIKPNRLLFTPESQDLFDMVSWDHMPGNVEATADGLVELDVYVYTPGEQGELVDVVTVLLGSAEPIRGDTLGARRGRVIRMHDHSTPWQVWEAPLAVRQLLKDPQALPAHGCTEVRKRRECPVCGGDGYVSQPTGTPAPGNAECPNCLGRQTVRD